MPFVFQINIIPQDSVNLGRQAGGSPGVLHCEPVSTSFLSLPPWGFGAPPLPAPGGHLSGPLSLPAFDHPHFQQHLTEVRQHHEDLQARLREHIQTFMQQQEENLSQGVPDSSQQSTQPSPAPLAQSASHTSQQARDQPSLYQQETSIHWRPAFPELRQDDNPSRSYLFTNLRWEKHFIINVSN